MLTSSVSLNVRLHHVCCKCYKVTNNSSLSPLCSSSSEVGSSSNYFGTGSACPDRAEPFPCFQGPALKASSFWTPKAAFLCDLDKEFRSQNHEDFISLILFILLILVDEIEIMGKPWATDTQTHIHEKLWNLWLYYKGNAEHRALSEQKAFCWGFQVHTHHCRGRLQWNVTGS